MRARLILVCAMMVLGLLPAIGRAQEEAKAGTLKVHAIFDSNMVIQRGKPIKVWGWAKPGNSVTVKLGSETGTSEVKPEAPVAVFGQAGDYTGLGLWEVTFPAREASADPQALVVTASGETITMTNVVIGDVWVMYGQSNIAFPLGKVQHRDTESAQANLPNLRLFSITGNEQADLQDDIRREKIDTGGWVVSTPERALAFSAIGYVFGAQIQRSLDIPIGVIKNARGGASMEGLVPFRKFEEDPKAKVLTDSIKARRATFDIREEALLVWGRQTARAKSKKLPEDKWPKKPEHSENVPSWNIPGMSPGHPGSVYNGMFGPFKGYNIKGVLFHHGHNNAMVRQGLRPKFYRWMMKAMMDGIREDFNDPKIAFGVIGFCAGSRPQNEEDFEAKSHGGAPFIREAQRLGVADMNDPATTGYIPAYDVQIPGLHPSKKREHGVRAARWALNKVYDRKAQWDEAKLLSVETKDDMMVLTYDKRVHPDDSGSILQGFSLAGEDGKFYLAYARNASVGRDTERAKTVYVWSPLVKNPVALRYAWGHAPMGNLKIQGHQDMPLPEFRTDSWDLPESEDLLVESITRELSKQWEDDGKARLDERQLKEAEIAKVILERLKTFSKPVAEIPEEAGGE